MTVILSLKYDCLYCCIFSYYESGLSVVTDCRAVAFNRKKLKNSLRNDGTDELVDVSNGNFHWIYRSADGHASGELLPYCYIV